MSNIESGGGASEEERAEARKFNEMVSEGKLTPAEAARVEKEKTPEEVEVKILPAGLSEVEPIKKSRALRVERPEDLKEVVETPLLKACQILYTKHIETYESSANKGHITYKHPSAALLTLNGDQLTPENLEIARKMADGETFGYEVELTDPQAYEPRYKMMVVFRVPMRDGIGVEEIEEKSVDFANRFIPNVIKIDVSNDKS